MRIATLASGFLIMLCLGAVYSWSVFRKPLETQLGISSFESGLPFVALLAVYSVSMLFTGGFIGRYRHYALIIFGAFLAASGWFMAGIFPDILAITLFYGGLTGAGIGIAYGVPLAAVIERFEKNRGAAMGFVLSGFGISAIVTAPLLGHMIADIGIQETFKRAGIAIFGVIAALAFFIRNKNPLSAENANMGGVLSSVAAYIKEGRFTLLWLSYFLGAFAGLTAISMTSPAAQELSGFSAKEAGFAVGIFALFNGLGRPLFGHVFDRLGFKKSALLNYALVITASGLALFFESGGKWLFYASFAILWFSLGGWLALAPAATASFFGAGEYRKRYGFIFTAYGFAAIAGVLLSGWLRDLSGTYKFTFILLLACSAAGVILNLIKGDKVEKGDIS